MVCLGTWRLNDIRGGVHGRLCPGTDPLLLVQWHGVPAEARGLRSHPSNLIWVIPAKGASLASCGTSGTSCRVHPASGSRSLASKRDRERVVLTLTVAFLLQTVPQVIIPGDSARDSTHVRRAQQLEAVQVTAIRGRAAPISAQTITRSELQRSYTGQETPILLQRAPGVTAYSESGSASNYSYILLRGIDQTRINITLDGIPLNEPEDEALYFSNFPDFANSISSVQVQRGVGSSAYGTASYAGSVNFESIPVGSVRRGGEIQLTSGSYNTIRESLVLQSGLSPSGFAGYVRGSSQRTDGYRFNSGNRSRSAFASGG